MKFFELKCRAYVKQDIDFKSSFEYISKYISYVISTSKLKDLHLQNSFKYYVFSNFYPPAKDGIYKKDTLYNFTIRTLNEELADILSNNLRENINNPNFLILSAQKFKKEEFFIQELYTLTPTIISIENSKYWTLQSSGDIMFLVKQLHENLVKKYNSFYGDNIKSTQNFIQHLQILNKTPQTINITKNGKKIRLFGNKFKIVPNEDETSQKLAFIALGAGLGEKNSFGGGFLVGKGVKI